MAIKRKATFQPYDMDTALGTNNSGVLMFGYSLEDTDTVSSIISGSDEGGTDAPVFNAQDSVLWCNLRDAFRGEISQMYQQLRTSGAWSAKKIIQLAKEHQGQWCEAIYNEDEHYKHLIPLIDPVTIDEQTGRYIKTDRYLTMLQGSKEEQRKWWVTNRFRYMDSKYITGDAVNAVISMRVFNNGKLTIATAIDLYVSVRWGGGSTPELQRTTANTPVEFTYTAQTGVTEMETWIYNADLITDVGDLSVFYGNEFDFSRATRLSRLKIGDADPNYSNANLKALDVRNSALLEYIDVRNCPNLAITVNLEGSPRLKEAYFDGTSITGVDLSEGGALSKLHLPGTITTLTLINLSKLSEFVCPSLENVSRLMLTNIDDDVVDPLTVLRQIKANSQVNIQGLYFEAANATEIENFLDLLDTMQGVSREKSATTGEWIYHDYDKAQVFGEIHTASLTGAQIASYNQRYQYLKVTADYVESYLTFKSYDGETMIKTVQCLNGVMQETAPSVPARPNSSDGHYSYTSLGWNTAQDSQTADPDALVDVIADRTVYPAYQWNVRTYTVTWVNNGTTIETDNNVAWGTIPHYDGATPTKDGQTSTGWLPDPTQPITGNTTFTAQYLPVYTVTFKNDTGSTTLDTQRVVQGQDATYGGTTPTSSEDASLAWLGWATSANSHTADAVLTNVQSSMTVYAAFASAVEVVEIEDDWATILSGTKEYKLGNYKPIYLGGEGVINMQIVGINADTKASGGFAKYSWLGMTLLNTAKVMNSAQKTVDDETAYTAGGWEYSDMRSYLKNTIKPLIPEIVRNAIVPVTKIQSIHTGGAKVIDGQTTTDDVWIPSNHEIFSTITTFETQGANYGIVFKTNTDRVKTRNGSASGWWLRSAYNVYYFHCVDSSGNGSNSYANYAYGVALGFCTD